jgi:hypothetical protein
MDPHIGHLDRSERSFLMHIRIKDFSSAPHPDPSSYAEKFSGKYSHRLIKGGIGHNLPQEAPQAFAKAVIDVDG